MSSSGDHQGPPSECICIARSMTAAAKIANVHRQSTNLVEADEGRSLAAQLEENRCQPGSSLTDLTGSKKYGVW